MNKQVLSSPSIERCVMQKTPLLWINDAKLSMRDAAPVLSLSLDDVRHAEFWLNRFGSLLATLFPELRATAGIIESPLHLARSLQDAMCGRRLDAGRWMIKADHLLPIAGSIKARGGIYEVLVHAHELALRHAVLSEDDDPNVLASQKARALFAEHRIVVGSTGNLGLSIGIIASVLGFKTTVHMSSDAKQWKKDRLRAGGVEVVEHDGDYGIAVATGRLQAAQADNVYFVDDEHSQRLFLGYSVAALRVNEQLTARSLRVDASHPLFVYLPCGVGGAPGGITLGLKHLFGDYVHCFFAEPVSSPCMLVRLMSLHDRPVSVAELGLDNSTEADGLAVGRASEFAAAQVRPLVSGIFTVRDADLFSDLYLLEKSEQMRIEPSAAAGFRGPHWLVESEAGREYLRRNDLLRHMREATHILWTTGGALLPDAQYSQFLKRGREAWGVLGREPWSQLS